ncbi:MAG: glycosyltransferase [Frankiaceae bacterium]|nr:glycosyltransferase [Frankiaceae bacterium]MBV9871497.1 glycosyltransferase [Frankiaceae bacterium]
MNAGQPLQPLVSIIIPSFNQGPYLRDALDSTLAQDYRPMEVIVVDGGSTDETVSILEEYGKRHPELRWWSEPDQGVADAVNKGLKHATGEFAGIQSSDDIYLPGAVATAVEQLTTHRDLGIVYGDGSIMDAQGARVLWDSFYPPFSMEAFLLGRTVLFQSSTFFRLDIARQVGGWRESCFVADLDLWLRMSFETKIEKIDQRFSVWRAHPGQRNERTREIWNSYGEMLDECEALQDAPRKLRRAAAAGRRLFTRHYNPSPSHWYMRYQLWRAILTYPRAISAIEDKTILIPGLNRLAEAAARLGLLTWPRQTVRQPLELRWWASSTVA